MIQRITGSNVNEVYEDALWLMQICGKREDSRNGPVISIPSPVILEIHKPWERVLFNEVRDANPFFHVMEFVWMMAGSNDAEWISMFNKRMMEYADDRILRGAYGWRWANPSPQIRDTISLLQDSPKTRQAVISMWDPVYDGSRAKSSDRPCNTHIYFRMANNRLDMTVCNRSNDLIWGMLGSNIVHFTMLHELIARAINVPQGIYRVFTNNLHIYTDMPRFDEIWRRRSHRDPYSYDEVRTQPLLEEGEKWEDFMADAYQMVDGGFDFEWGTTWFQDVASPMYEAYLDKQNRDHWIASIGAPDWNKVCSEWNIRRIQNAKLAG